MAASGQHAHDDVAACSSSTPAAQDSIQTRIALKEVSRDMVDALIGAIEQSIETTTMQLRSMEIRRTREATRNFLQNAKVPVTSFLPPYFENEKGYAPKPNDEALAKRQIADIDSLIKPLRPWTERENKMLKDAVAAEMLSAQLDTSKRDKAAILEKLRNADASMSKEEFNELQEALAQKNRLIDFITATGGNQTSDFSCVNWNRLSNLVFKNSRTPIEIQLYWINQLDPSITRDKWSDEEINELKTRVGLNRKFINWQLLAEQMGRGRKPWQVYQKFQEVVGVNDIKQWSVEEDKKLASFCSYFQQGVAENGIPWEKVAAFMVGRTSKECRKRWRAIDQSLKHGRWEEEEDILLLCAVDRFGAHAWDKVAKTVKGRNEYQCKQRFAFDGAAPVLRWTNIFSLANTELGNLTSWTLLEDELIVQGVKIFGRGRWRAISDTLLPNRQPFKIRSRFYSLVTTKLRFSANQTNSVRTSQQVQVVRAVVEKNKRNKVFERVVELSGQRDVVSGLSTKGLEKLQSNKLHYAPVISSEEQKQAQRTKEQVELLHEGVEGINDNESTDIALRILSAIDIEDGDMRELTEKNERKKKTRKGNKSVALDRVPRSEMRRKFRRRLRPPAYEQAITITESDAIREDVQACNTAINALAQILRRADIVNMDEVVHRSAIIQREMRGLVDNQFYDMLERSGFEDDGEIVLPPNMGTLTMHTNLLKMRKQLMMRAMGEFQNSLPLDEVPAINNRLHFDFSEEVVLSPEFIAFRTHMRSLLKDPVKMHEALWTPQDETDWMQLHKHRDASWNRQHWQQIASESFPNCLTELLEMRRSTLHVADSQLEQPPPDNSAQMHSLIDTTINEVITKSCEQTSPADIKCVLPEKGTSPQTELRDLKENDERTLRDVLFPPAKRPRLASSSSTSNVESSTSSSQDASLQHNSKTPPSLAVLMKTAPKTTCAKTLVQSLGFPTGKATFPSGTGKKVNFATAPPPPPCPMARFSVKAMYSK